MGCTPAFVLSGGDGATPKTYGTLCDSAGCGGWSVSQPFLIYPENVNYLSGKTRRPEYGQSDTNIGCALLILIPMLLGAVFFVMWTGNLLYENARLLLEGTVTTGVVRQHYIDFANSADDATTYHIVYGLTVDGAAYERDQSVPQDVHARYAVGEVVEVRYVPASPDISRIDGVSTLWGDTASILFTAGWLFATVVVTVGYFATRHRLGRLKRVGQVLVAELTGITGDDPNGEEYHIEVEVRFRSPSTLQWVAGKRKYMVLHLRHEALPQAGTPLRVVYADDRMWEVL
jgi:hypothetical protein